jgi:nitronate monooxygenase
MSRISGKNGNVVDGRMSGASSAIFTADSAFPLDVRDRVLSNEFTQQWHERDAEVVRNRADIQQQIAAGTEARDISVVPARAGNALGLLSSIEPAGAILRRIIEEAEAILTKRPSELLSR